MQFWLMILFLKLDMAPEWDGQCRRQLNTPKPPVTPISKSITSTVFVLTGLWQFFSFSLQVCMESTAQIRVPLGSCVHQFLVK
ncbi:hypothetical protein M758_4G027800 [Ceratodon purpureus]|nr:hypothetical protein M758_4G027800 [Ceratodon purpureus]